MSESTNYALVVWSQSGNGSADLRYSSTSGGNGRYATSQTYGSWPLSVSFTTNNYQYSIHCNYVTAFKAQAVIYSSDGNTRLGTTEEKIITSIDGERKRFH